MVLAAQLRRGRSGGQRVDLRTGPADAAAMTTGDRIQALAARLLRDAPAVDASGTLPAGHLDGLAEAGLYGIFAPPAAGGLGLATGAVYAAVEELASACLATTFVWIQHFGLVAALL